MIWQRKGKIASLLMCLLLAGVLIVALRIPIPVKALAWEVDLNGGRDYTKIQDAIDNADIGLTDNIIVYPGIYNETINVTKSWKIKAVNENPAETVIHGDGSHYTLIVSANDTRVEGFTIENGIFPYSGVFLSNISGSQITSNVISINGVGISIAVNSTDNVIENNTLTLNQVGIHASGNHLRGAHNRIEDNLVGVELDSTSSYFTLFNNTITSNLEGITVFGSSNRIEDNNVTMNYINGMYLMGENHTVIGNNVTLNDNVGIYLSVCRNSTIFQNKIEQNVEYGIRLSNSSNNEMSDNEVGHVSSGYQQEGISLSLSNSNIIKDNIIMNNVESGIHLENSSNNTIFNNNVIGNDLNGITIQNSQENNISINNVEWNNVGISLTNATNNIINSNRFHRNRNGILMMSSDFNEVRLNNISGNRLGVGLRIDSSEKNILDRNAMDMNAYNFGVRGSKLSQFIHNIPITNTIDGRQIYYLINQSNLHINSSTFPNMGYLAVINSTAIIVKGYLEQNNNLQGVVFAWTTNSKIEALNLSANFYGLYILHSSNNTIKTSRLSHNFYGLYFLHSSNNTILRNGVIGNGYGVYMSSSHNITLIDNGVLSNTYGIHFSTSGNNTITHNNVQDNDVAAIRIEQSSANVIYNNNFADTKWVTISGFAPNNWNYSVVGNYWHDYEGEPPYTIDDYNLDYHPLDHPVISSLVGDCDWDGDVDIFDMVNLCGAYDSEPGDSNWDPYVDLIENWRVDIFDVVLAAQNYGARWD